MTPSHHEDKNNIKLAQDKIEAALEQMNKVRMDQDPVFLVWQVLKIVLVTFSY